MTCTSVFQDDMDLIAGRTLYNSGITERIARPCSHFYRGVERDPCVGTLEKGTIAPTPTITESPETSPDDASVTITTVTSALIAGSIMAMLGI